MKLNELKIQSFQTTLQEDIAETLRGGTGNFCYSVSIHLNNCYCRFCDPDDTD